jgi:nucleoside-diphosphate-sugar epimerase
VKVLVLGADGFIGRHIAFALRDQGVEVLAHARAPARLAAMGFATLAADLTDSATHEPGFWAPHLTDCHVINAAGLLTGSKAQFRAVHQLVPAALMAARPVGCRILHISAVEIDRAETGFARWRRETERVFQDQIILRPGLVLAETSYGGSSLLRALAALPFVTPVVGDGRQAFNPIHAADLAQAAHEALAAGLTGTWEIGGPETLDQRALVATLRGWMGLAPARLLRLPYGFARAVGRLGDALRLGPISATAVAQLEAGVLADAGPLLQRLTFRPRPVTGFIAARPAGTQDLWQARLYLLKPLIRLTLAALWLASAGLGLCTPVAEFLPAVAALPESLATLLARAGGLADAALGLALLANWRPRGTALAQLALVLAYTLGLTLIAPGLWLDPFGGLLKNLPVLALILTHLALIEER